jgi:hypothetical protein
VTQYFIEDDGGNSPHCHAMRSRYYPITTVRLMELMIAAGFTDVKRLDGVYFQPVLIGSRTT